MGRKKIIIWILCAAMSQMAHNTVTGNLWETERTQTEAAAGRNMYQRAELAQPEYIITEHPFLSVFCRYGAGGGEKPGIFHLEYRRGRFGILFYHTGPGKYRMGTDKGRGFLQLRKSPAEPYEAHRADTQ